MRLLLVLFMSLACGRKPRYAGCANKKGTYVMNFVIHLSAPTKAKIEQYEEKKQGKTLGGKGAKHFFNRIFDRVNEDIQKYDIQVLGDYRYLSFEKLGVPVSGDICTRPSVVPELMASFVQTVKEPAFPGTGNRIVIFDCGVNLGMIPQSLMIPPDRCGHYIVLMHNPLPLFEDEIRGHIMNTLANIPFGTVQPNSKLFVSSACAYAKQCAVDNDFVGQFFQDVKSVRHTLYLPGDQKVYLSGNHRTGMVVIDENLRNDDKTV
jgi:hypothetical protein